MKKVLILGLFAIGSLAMNAQAKKGAATGITEHAPAEEIHWVTVNELPALMAKQPKKVFMDVYTSWCGPCKMMLANTFHDPKIVKYVNENFYAVKFNAEGNEVVKFKGYDFTNPGYDPAKANTRNSTHDFALAVAPVQTRIAYPTIVYFDEKLNIIAPLQGYYPPEQFQPVLTYFKENKQNEINLQDYLNQASGKQ